MSLKALQFNKFEIKSNVNDDTVDLRGSGTPIIEYRESIFMPYVEITAFIIDTGNTLPADDGSGAGVGYWMMVLLKEQKLFCLILKMQKDIELIYLEIQNE